MTFHPSFLRWIRASIALAFFVSTISKPVFSNDTTPISSSVQISDPSQAKFIDSFEKNDPEKPRNEIGGAISATRLEFEYIHTPYTFGNSLQLKLHLNRGEQASWTTDLNGLDVSQAEAFSLWIRSNVNILQDAKLILIDDFDKKVEIGLASHAKKENDWQEIFIPIEQLKSLNLNRLSQLRLEFQASQNDQGQVWIDNIAFLGPPHFSFFSLRDNLNGFPDRLLNPEQRKILKKGDYYFLQDIAKDTWGFFRDLVDKRTHLPLDNARLSPELAPERRIGDYTSPTTMGLYLASCAAASKLGFISEKEAIKRIQDCLETAKQLKRWNGFLFNYYNTTNLRPTHLLVSTVDNAWWAAGLIIAREAFPQAVGPLANDILKEMNFNQLYDTSMGQFRLGYDAENKTFRKEHYGLLETEARVVSFVAMAKGDVDKKHWFKIYRTLPAEWTWQNQKPRGHEQTLMEVPFFEGYYLYEDKQPVVPSWGGSLFEFLMPLLIVDEVHAAPRSLGLNDKRAVEIHRQYALEKQRYPVWGLSPCTVPNTKGDNYGEYGVASIGSKGYEDKGVITPHVSFLALMVSPEQALQNIRELLSRYDIYGPYGFYDSVQVNTRTVGYTYLALDQAMIFLSIANYLKQGYIQHLFEQSSGMQDVLNVLKEESFFNGANL